MTLVLTVDALTCELTDGHAGPHRGTANGRRYFWQYA